MASYWKNGVIVLVSGIIGLIVAELALRYVSPSTSAVLMMSPPAMIVAAEGVVTYAPDSPLRIAAVDQQGVIYDVRVRTNNAGLIDDVPFFPSDADYQIALVGDSFTAGYHGGKPWVPALRETVPSAWRVYGLGVDGTGVQHFEALLTYVDPDATFDQVFVIVIDHDFLRDHWFVSGGPEGVWFCRAADTRERCTEDEPPIIHHVPYDASHEQVLAAAQKVFDAREQAEQPMRIPALLRQAAAALRAPDKTEWLLEPEVMRNLKALERIVDRYGRERVTVVHLPALPEVIQGDYHLDLAGFANQHSISYFPALTECPFSVDMFNAREPHPNAIGYEHIGRCVEQAMRQSISAQRLPRNSQATEDVATPEGV